MGTTTYYATGNVRATINGVNGNHNQSITDHRYSPKDFKEKYGVNERRYVIVKEFTDKECRRMIGYETDENGRKYADIDSVEVRVLRINPSYMDEQGTKKSDGYQNMSYQDLCIWNYMRTFSFDKNEYKNALDKGFEEFSKSDDMKADLNYVPLLDTFTADVENDSTNGYPDVVITTSRIPTGQLVRFKYKYEINSDNIGMRFKNKSDEVSLIVFIAYKYPDETEWTVTKQEIGTASTESRFVNYLMKDEEIEFIFYKVVDDGTIPDNATIYDYTGDLPTSKVEYLKALDNGEFTPALSTSVDKFPLRPLSQEDMDKFCVVALTLKQDVAETGGATLKKMDLIAESFNPTCDTETGEWYPKEIKETQKYYEVLSEWAPDGKLRDKIEYITKEEYESKKELGRDVGISKSGNDFVKQLKDELFNEDNFKGSSTYDNKVNVSNPARVHLGNDFRTLGWDYDGDWGDSWRETILKSDYNSSIVQNGDNDVAYIISHVTGEGTILTPSQFNSQLEKISKGYGSDYNIIIKSIKGSGCLDRASKYGISNHDIATIYFCKTVHKKDSNIYTDDDVEEAERLINSVKGKCINDISDENLRSFMEFSLFEESDYMDGMTEDEAFTAFKPYFIEALVDFGIVLGNESIYNYQLPQELEDKCITNNAAAVSLLTLIGPHLGKNAKTYNDVNMDSFSEFYKFCEDVTDSSYNEDDGSLRHYFFACNGVVTSEIKMETLFQKVLFTGRSSFRRDDENKYEVVIGRAGQYPVAMINQQNCLAFSNSRDFSDKPSGFHCQFIDETDNYNTNDVYVMMDGEDYANPTGSIEELQIPYITDREQLWSIARSNLGARVLQRETYSRTVGKVGYALSYGDVVLLQDYTLLVGTDNGGRIREIIQDSQYIYGFTVSEPFTYKGEETFEGSGICKQGVTIVQPQKSGPSRCVTLRMSMPYKKVQVTSKPETIDDRTKIQTKTLQAKDDSRIIGWSDAVDELENTFHEYWMKPGITNLVLLDEKISKVTFDSKDCPEVTDEDDNSISVNVVPKYDNLVAFGDVESITIKAVITSIKKSDGEKFQLQLAPYDDDLYQMGGTMPKFDAHITQPNEELGNAFDGAVTIDDVHNVATSAANAAVSPVITLISNLTSLYTLDLTPEFQTIAVTSTGKIISQEHVYIGARFYYNGQELKASELPANESLLFKAFISNKEVGEWLIGDEYQEELESAFGNYDGFPVVKITTKQFENENTLVSIYAEHKIGDDTNSKTGNVTVARLSYGDSLIWYDMTFPHGSGSIKKSWETPTTYTPSNIYASKRKVFMEGDMTVYQPTDYGRIVVRFYDSDGNEIPSEDGEEIVVGNYIVINADEEFDEKLEYCGKYNPIMIKLFEDSQDVVVLGYDKQDTGLNEDVAMILYERDSRG